MSRLDAPHGEFISLPAERSYGMPSYPFVTNPHPSLPQGGGLRLPFLGSNCRFADVPLHKRGPGAKTILAGEMWVMTSGSGPVAPEWVRAFDRLYTQPEQDRDGPGYARPGRSSHEESLFHF